jgi:hypothetical protein
MRQVRVSVGKLEVRSSNPEFMYYLNCESPACSISEASKSKVVRQRALADGKPLAILQRRQNAGDGVSSRQKRER